METTASTPSRFIERFNKQQLWLDKMEMNEMRRNYGLTNLADYNWSCRTCKSSGVHHDAMTMKLKLNNHIGHDFWIDYAGGQRSR